ncbi:MAG: hypothetical protein FWG73_07150 [Planctomycetaceae bacterium]|nr:hypothetical protein [Planctomycetaceae bacterium]
MTSSIHKKLAGAALAAAITLGGFTSAHAQFYNEPLPEDPMFEDIFTDEGPLPPLIEETELFDDTAEQMHGDSEGYFRLHQHVLR